MKAISSTLTTVLLSSALAAAQTPVRNNGKRGLCWNDIDLTQPYSLSGQNSKVSWDYNWYFSECPAWEPNCGTHNPALDFVPMLYSDSDEFTSAWPTAVQRALDNGRDMLFSFNEPDACFAGMSACMSIERAVTAYKRYMMPYAGQIRIGTPSVTNAGGEYGLDWLRRFMAACDGCRFDYVNIHWYSNKYAGLNYLQSHINETRALAGGRPIVLSEFGLINEEWPYTQAELQDFLRQSMTWMDSQPDIIRYAYFMNSPGQLINAAGTGLSDLGRIYNSYPSSSSGPSSSTTTRPSTTTTRPTTTSTSASTTTTRAPAPSAPPTTPRCPASNALTYGTSNARRFRIECGQNRRGSAFGIMRGATFSQCINACAARERCVDLSFVAAEGTCTLKSSVGVAVGAVGTWGARGV
ncbi:hypothetical protein MBLNU230_g0213t1 [Neophaeotheca triangularis]